MHRRLQRGLNVARHRLAVVPLAVAVAVIGINSALTLLTQPAQVPAHALLSPWDYCWAVLYGLGGLLIIVGIATARANVEAAGCVAFAGGALVSAVTLALLDRWTAWNRIAVLLIFACAMAVRVVHLAQGRVLVLIELSDRPTEIAKVVTNGSADG